MLKQYSQTSNLTDLGIHVFEQTANLDWEEEIIGINLLSTLSWKRFHGPIHLFCNQRFFETLKKWGVDTFYDLIDTTTLESNPKEIDYKTYYAFSKIYVLSTMKLNQPFTLLDNDLWLMDKLDFDNQYDVIMYHKESFSEDYHFNVYPNFDTFVSDEFKKLDFDKSVLPTNTALLHIKNKTFINDWFELSKSIATENISTYNFTNKSVKMCFIEQRLLPMLLEKMNIPYSTFIDHIYQTHLCEKQDGSEWYPLLQNSTNEQVQKFFQIKHVWGMKKLFNNEELRHLVMSSCVKCLLQYISPSDLPIVNKLSSLYNH